MKKNIMYKLWISYRMRAFAGMTMILISFIFILAGCEEPNSNYTGHPSFTQLEYQITGGEAGVQYQTTISENGEAVFSHYYKNKKYIISVMLPKEQFDSLKSVLSENNIFNLLNEYKTLQPGADGFEYKISYSSLLRGSKNIVIEDGTEIPVELKNIIHKLFEINSFIQSNADYGTLTTIWDQKETIKKWPFPVTKLEKKAFYYNEISNSAAVLSYFNEIKKTAGYNILYWDRDSLYTIYDGGTNYGYFNTYEVFPIKIWPGYFQADISTVQNAGIVQSTEKWKSMDILFNKTYVYVIDKLEDNGKAIKLKLIPGKPYNN